MKKVAKRFLCFVVAMTAMTIGAFAQDTYTVAGSDAAIVNGNDAWAPTNSANDMTYDGNGNWKLELSNKTLSAGNIEYKIVKGHDWNSGSCPTSNATLNIPSSGVYDVTFTFSSNEAVSATATPVLTPKALWLITDPNDNMGTLVFVYDNVDYVIDTSVYNLNGTDYTVKQVYSAIYNGVTPGWSTHDDYIKAVLFESSFAAFKPTNVQGWFQRFHNMTSITGMEYFDTSLATDMSYLFGGCTSLTTLDVSSLNTDNVTNMQSMFNNCRSLVSLSGLSNINTSNVTTMANMFDECKALTSLDLSTFDTRNVTNMYAMFTECESLETLNLGGDFNTSNVESMYCMFAGCVSLRALDLSNFNTAKVKNMNTMFAACMSLTTLDLNHFNTSSLEDAEGMFAYCTSLTTIYCSNDWKSNKVTSSDDMFADCTAPLTSVSSGESYDAGNANDINFANPTTGYFTIPKIAKALWLPTAPGGGTLVFVYDTVDYTSGTYRIGGTDYPVTEIYDVNSSHDWADDEENPDIDDIVHITIDPNFASYQVLVYAKPDFHFWHGVFGHIRSNGHEYVMCQIK